MRRSALVLLSLTAACARASSSPDPTPATGDSGRAAVMQADLDYAAATAARRLDGWMSFLAADMVKAPWAGQFVKGLAAIRAQDAGIFADTTMMLEWKPTDGGVYSDGRYGYTKGRYEMVRRAGGTRTVVGRGAYLTMWRHDPAGWRVVLDTGVPDSRQ
jgi:ketosteroid isomerase-like protein